MLNINKEKLKNLLIKRKEKIEIGKYTGLSEIVSGISLMISLLCSTFNDKLILDALYIEIIAWIISLLILFWGIYQLIKSNLRAYSINDLYNDLVELSEGRIHVFNIILLKNNQTDGKYLLFYSKRWKCKLFLNYKVHLLNNYDPISEINSIVTMFSRDTGFEFDASKFNYLGNTVSEKYSYGDNVEKNYKFYFYTIEGDLPQGMQVNNFKYNGNKYYWMTLEQMYSNKNIVKKNKDILDFIREKTTVA